MALSNCKVSTSCSFPSFFCSVAAGDCSCVWLVSSIFSAEATWCCRHCSILHPLQHRHWLTTVECNLCFFISSLSFLMYWTNQTIMLSSRIIYSIGNKWNDMLFVWRSFRPIDTARCKCSCSCSYFISTYLHIYISTAHCGVTKVWVITPVPSQGLCSAGHSLQCCSAACGSYPLQQHCSAT